MLLKVLILFIVHLSGLYCILHSFPVQYIGNTFSVEEYKELNVCYSRICVRDSKRAIAHSSLRNDSNPCEDFREFACGHFFEFRATNDRNDYIGFDNEIVRRHQDRLKKVLRVKIDKDEPKIFQIVKSFFQKCVNSTKVITEGRAEIFEMLSEFGKIPVFEANWKPSDFNLTKAKINQSKWYGCTFLRKSVEHMLHFDLGLSRNLSSTIYKEFMEITDKDFYIDKDGSPPSYYAKEYKGFEYLRKWTNSFMVHFIMQRIVFFSVYPEHFDKKRPHNRYETCIEQINNFPLQVMHQLKHQKQINKSAFKDFISKALLMEYKVVIDLLINPNETMKEKFKNEIIDTRIYVGLPDELINKEFLNKLYANLNLTGEESAYKMHQEMRNYQQMLYDEEIPTYIQNISENTREVFESCGSYPWECQNLKNVIAFSADEILYPLFHPERQYFVNLAYFYEQIHNHVKQQATKYFGDLQTRFKDRVMNLNYIKYEKQFGLEQNLPGFLMTNQQMLQMIFYQSKCRKWQNGLIDSNYSPSNRIFNCQERDVDEKFIQTIWYSQPIKPSVSCYYNSLYNFQSIQK